MDEILIQTKGDTRMKECIGNTVPEHPPPDEKMRRELGPQSQFHGDFINDQASPPYEFTEGKSIPATLRPTALDSICVSEISSDGRAIPSFPPPEAAEMSDRGKQLCALALDPSEDAAECAQADLFHETAPTALPWKIPRES
jgi:hypothetical protein